MTPTAVHVYESYNPGALYRITARDSSGREIEIWSGEDPIPIGSKMGTAAISVEAGFKTDLAGPDFASDTKAELMKDRATWGYPPAYEELVTSGMSSDEALEQGQRELHLEAMDRKVKAVHGDDVVFKMDGWYKGGRRIARNPYYAGD